MLQVKAKMIPTVASVIRKTGILGFKVKLKNPALQSMRMVLVKKIAGSWTSCWNDRENSYYFTIPNSSNVIGLYAIL